MKTKLYIYRVILPLITSAGVKDCMIITILAKNTKRAEMSAKAMGGDLLDCAGGYA